VTISANAPGMQTKDNAIVTTKSLSTWLTDNISAFTLWHVRHSYSKTFGIQILKITHQTGFVVISYTVREKTSIHIDS